MLACAWSGPATAELPKPLVARLAKEKVSANAVSLSVQRLTDGQMLLAHNVNVPRNPASVIKLVTTLAGLQLLGPQYRWQTRYYADGKLEDGVLHGNLVIRGEGDPLLTLEHFWLQLRELRQRGLRRITGDLVIDSSVFALLPHDRSAFDGRPQRLYNVGPAALVTNFSATRFILEPQGSRVRLTVDPPLHDLALVNRLRTKSGACRHSWKYIRSEEDGQHTATFSGDYRTSCGRYEFGRSLYDHASYTHQLFNLLWQQLGGEFTGGWRDGRVPGTATLIAELDSPPLAEIITGINKHSNNLMARQLLLTLALRHSGEPATLPAGVLAAKQWLKEAGIHMPQLVLDNGSGLSRRSRLTSAGLNRMLEKAWHSRYQPEFFASLSLAGVDGSMKKRLEHLTETDRLRIKTGYLTGVRSLAGFLHGADGHWYSIVMLIESKRVTIARGNRLQDALLEWLIQTTR